MILLDWALPLSVWLDIIFLEQKSIGAWTGKIYAPIYAALKPNIYLLAIPIGPSRIRPPSYCPHKKDGKERRSNGKKKRGGRKVVGQGHGG